MRYKFIFLSFLFFNFLAANAQEITDLEKAFMENCDSTIILEGTGHLGFRRKNAFMVSKTGDNISCYLYHFYIYDLPRFKNIPKTMANYLEKQETYDRYSDTLEVNRFFEIFNIGKDTASNLWRELSALKPWKFGDDSTYGVGCPVERTQIVRGDTVITREQSFGIMDGGIYILKLITKDGVKRLSYYMPEEVEKACPGKPGRQHAIKLKELILTAFKKDSVFF